MAFIGMVFEPTVRFGYEAFLSPLIFGAAASFPMLVKYTKKELSLTRTLIRNVLHLVLLETVILAILYIGGLITSISLAVSLGASILVVASTVNLVLWIQGNRTAKEFNDTLRRLQSGHSTGK